MWVTFPHLRALSPQSQLIVGPKWLLKNWLLRAILVLLKGMWPNCLIDTVFKILIGEHGCQPCSKMLLFTIVVNADIQ